MSRRKLRKERREHEKRMLEEESKPPVYDPWEDYAIKDFYTRTALEVGDEEATRIVEELEHEGFFDYR